MNKLTLFSIFAIIGIAFLTTAVRCRSVELETDIDINDDEEKEAIAPEASPGAIRETPIEEEDAEPICICTMELNPVCGSNNRTYANPCKFRCHAKTPLKKRLNLFIKHFGECINSTNKIESSQLEKLYIHFI